MSTPSLPDRVARVPARHPSDSTASARSSERDLEKHGGQDEEPGANLRGPSPGARGSVGSGSSGSVGPGTNGSVGEGTQRPAGEKKLAWYEAGIYMLAYNMSIGILALARAFAHLGLVGGLLFTWPYALLNYYTSLINWQLMRRYRVTCWPQLLGVIFGPYGEWFGHILQGLLQFFLMMVHVMTAREAIEAVSWPQYVVCGAWWTFLAAAVMFGFSLRRSIKDNMPMAAISCLSILVATVLTIVSIISDGGDVSDHHAFRPVERLLSSKLGSGMTMIAFAFTGQLATPQIISEMADPEGFPKALKLDTIVKTAWYTISACIVYWFTGDIVKAPALNSATGPLSKVAWYSALPTIIAAGVLPAAMIIQNAVRGFWTWRGLPHVAEENNWLAKGSRCAVAGVLWPMAAILAEAIPSFMGVIGVAGALLGSWISCVFPALAWFCMNRTRAIDWTRSMLSRGCSNSNGSTERLAPTGGSGDRAVDHKAVGSWVQFWSNTKTNARERPFTAVLVAMIFLLGIFLCIFGGYGAIFEMVHPELDAKVLRPFSCRRIESY